MNKGNTAQTGATNKPEVSSTNGAGRYFAIGLLVCKLFPQYGCYKGKLSQINRHAPIVNIYRIRFDDKYQEDWSSDDIE